MEKTAVNTLEEEISSFHEKYKGTKLETPEELSAYIADAEEILGRYPNPEGEMKKELAKFCSHLGCWVVVFGQDIGGIEYYRKSIALDPESYDLRWEYYTTLEELVEDEEYATPELIKDAVDCLRFCIDYCDTPERRAEKFVHYRYLDLGRVYMAAGEYAKAKKCAKQSLKTEDNEGARRLLKSADKELSKTGFFKRLLALIGINFASRK